MGCPATELRLDHVGTACLPCEHRGMQGRLTLSETEFPLLFRPLQMRPVQARNRIVLGPHFSMLGEPAAVFGEPGLYGERYARYLADRAAVGVGTVIAGQAHVHPSSAYQMRNNSAAWVPEAVPGFRLVTDALHAHGTVAFLQLSHNGARRHPAIGGGDRCSRRRRTVCAANRLT